MIIFTLILSILLNSVHFTKACTNSTIVNCATIYNNARLLNVIGLNSTGICVVVPIGTTNVIYDPVTINYVWITLVNTIGTCIADIPALTQSLTTSLNILSSQEIILLNITAAYYRLVLVSKGCTLCQIDSFNSSFETMLISAKVQIYPIYNDLNPIGPYCLNGGYIDTTYIGAGYKCVCPSTTPFTGPSCEFLERNILSTQTFFNVIQSSTIINIIFAFFSNGITQNLSLLSIKNAMFQNVVEVFIVESSIVLRADGKSQTSIIILDNQNWFDFNIIITQQNAALSVNYSNIILPMTSTATADFRSFYIVLNEGGVTKFSLCIKNLLIGSRIIDLNIPGYVSSCNNRCSNCNSNQICVCRPFISQIEQLCYCNFGFQQLNQNCVKSQLSYLQIPSGVVTPTPISLSQSFGRLDFGFQTLSINGNLMALYLSTPSITIQIQIVNTALTLNIPNFALGIINFNVSNGFPHTVTLTINQNVIQLILDNNVNYTTSIFSWINRPVPFINITSLSLGMMQQPFISAFNNLSTCFSTIQLNGSSNTVSATISQVSNTLPGCSTGLPCSMVNCPNNSVCLDKEWQNTKCICVANYSFVNTICTPNLCVNNPCVNGVCYINQQTNNYSCICPVNTLGPNCLSPYVSVAGLWWIAILIILLVLLILIIIIIVVCCCCLHKSEPETVFIDKVNENTAVYNEQAGETDYEGPPINFTILKNALGNKPVSDIRAPIHPIPDFQSTKDNMEKNNIDLILDYPLEYGFEGYESESESLSPIGSINGDTEVDIYFDMNDLPEQQ